MSRRTRTISFVVVALAAASGGAFAWQRSRAPDLHVGGAAAPVTAAQAATAGPAVGDQRRWKLAFEAGMSEKRAGAAEPMTMRMSASWVVTVVATRDDAYDVACEVVAPKVSGGGVAGVQAAEVEALERRMARRFFVTYRRDGAAQEIYFPRDVDPGARNLLQLIVTDTQLVRPARPAPRWTAVERDGAGSYLAAYHETAPGQLVKTKLKYLDTDGAAGPNGAAPKGVDVLIAASTRHLTIDRGDGAGGLIAFDGGDTMRIDLPMSSGAVAMRVSARLSDLARGHDDALVGALDRARATLDKTAIVTHALSDEQAQAQRDRELTAGATFEKLFRAVHAGTDDGRAPMQLAAWLRLHPDDIAAMAAAVRAQSSADAAKLLLQAMARAGSPAAQAALCALASTPDWPGERRADALVALMVVKRPTAETARSVRALLDAENPVLRRAARFASGTVAHAGRETIAADAQALDAALAQRLKSAKDVAARVELIDAMGNSAGPTSFPALEAALNDGEARVRAAAAGALRLYGDEAARTLLARTFTSDRDDSVRAAAIVAAGFAFDDQYVAPLAKAALGDAAEFVRSDATSLLGRHLDASDEVKSTLERVATNDPKPAVRKEARAALDRAR
jgi:HEAT repeat protein